LIIDSYRGPYKFLSNFYWPSQVLLDFQPIAIRRELEQPSLWLHAFRTLEHGFQAAKFVDFDCRQQVRNIFRPGDAKRYATEHKHLWRPDWHNIKIYVMLQLLLQKFSVPELRDRLLATGDAVLVEGNTWDDKFWGMCDGEGYNWLGQLQMLIREYLRTGNQIDIARIIQANLP
jgi:ribA/ribD-fused uncharacterized protein